MPTTSVLPDLGPRLQAAAAAVADAREAHRLRLLALKRLVVQAANEGMSQRQIAAAAGYAGPGRVTQILAESWRHDGDDQ